MTYNKRHKSYKKGKGRSRRRSSFLGSLMKVLLSFVLLAGVGVFVAMNLGLESFPFTINNTGSNENIVEEIEEEINTDVEEVIDVDEEIKVVENMEFDEKQYIVSDTSEPLKSDDGNFISPQEMAYFTTCEGMTDKEKQLCNKRYISQYANSRIYHAGGVSLDRRDTPGNWSLRFMVDKEGNVTNIEAQCEQERENKIVESKLKNMPPWTPAQHNGKTSQCRISFSM